MQYSPLGKRIYILKKVNENIAKAVHIIYEEETDAAGIDKTTFKATNYVKMFVFCLQN